MIFVCETDCGEKRKKGRQRYIDKPPRRVLCICTYVVIGKIKGILLIHDANSDCAFVCVHTHKKYVFLFLIDECTNRNH